MRPEIVSLLDDAAKRHGLDAALLRAVAWVESRGEPLALNKASGAVGVMQLMPITVANFHVSDPYDPAQNIDAGAATLAVHLNRFGGEQKALAAYNWGGRNVAQRPIPATVHLYVRRVLARRELEASGLAEHTGPEKKTPTHDDSHRSPLARLSQGSPPWHGPEASPLQTFGGGRLSPLAEAQESAGTWRARALAAEAELAELRAALAGPELDEQEAPPP